VNNEVVPIRNIFAVAIPEWKFIFFIAFGLRPVLPSMY
jgi:hypothetical protein